MVEKAVTLFINANCKRYNSYTAYKRSVLRRQSRDTNKNIERSVYCQYG